MDDWSDLCRAQFWLEVICRGLLVLGLKDRNVIPHRLCELPVLFMDDLEQDCNNSVALRE